MSSQGQTQPFMQLRGSDIADTTSGDLLCDVLQQRDVASTSYFICVLSQLDANG